MKSVVTQVMDDAPRNAARIQIADRLPGKHVIAVSQKGCKALTLLHAESDGLAVRVTKVRKGRARRYHAGDTVIVIGELMKEPE